MKIHSFDEINRFDKFKVGDANDAYNTFFSGKSFLRPLTNKECGLSLANVTFEPSCRNNYHIHRADKGGGQILIVTAGEGWYVDDKESIELSVGDVITIPPFVRHWHGAKSDSWFSHIAIEIPGENASTERGEAVSDAEYFRLERLHGSNKPKSDKLLSTISMLNDTVRCAVMSGENVFTDSKQGISPLLEVVESGRFLGCIAADRIVGKAAALLYAYLGAKEVYGSVMSEEGEKTLDRFNIEHSCKRLVKFIRNRKGDGICPMEKTVENIDEPSEALRAIKAKLISLKAAF